MTIAPPLPFNHKSSEAEDFSLLIGEIYDTALEPLLWPDVLKGLARFVGGSAASLFAKSNSGKTGEVFYQDGSIPAEYVQAYFDKSIRFDPTTIGQFCFEIGEPFTTSDVLDYREFTESRFYKEWAEPLGLVDHIAVALEKSASGVALFGVFRNAQQGRVDAEARRRMALIAPHVRRAVLIGKVIETKTAEAASLADSLDGIAAGIYLIDASGRIVHANAAGLALIATNDIVHARGGKLALRDAETLRDVLIAADHGDAITGASAVTKVITAGDGSRFAAHILPLLSGARRKVGASYKAVAAVFIQKAELETRAPAEVIARSWKLTPTELRVLLAIVEVGGVPEVALALGIAETTVKTHLGHLFAKTGTGRQADLVKLVAGFSNPLRSISSDP